jgi:hypothetical protein
MAYDEKTKYLLPEREMPPIVDSEYKKSEKLYRQMPTPLDNLELRKWCIEKAMQDVGGEVDIEVIKNIARFFYDFCTGDVKHEHPPLKVEEVAP